jgi:hypothetical protein
MACPYFCPTERLPRAFWPHPDRLPLGGGFDGFCRVRPAAEFRPGDARLREHCNLGYARGECGDFPLDADCDAVRFGISEEREEIVLVCYVLERDHRPFAHGFLQYHAGSRRFLSAPADPVLQRQAEAYADGYLRSKLRSSS